MNCFSTRPVALPVVDSSQSWFKRVTATGKGYVNLYKTGIKNVWKNQKECRELKKSWNFKNIKELSQYVVDNAFAQDSSKLIDGEARDLLKPAPNHITRAQYMLLLRTKRDILKLPFFAVIFAVFFETTPLLVLLFPRLTPVTCYTPSAIKNQTESREKHIKKFKTLETSGSSESKRYAARSVFELSRNELNALAIFTEKLWLPPLFYTQKHLQMVINSYLVEIRCDNILLGRFGGVQQLDDYETAGACLARGISIENKAPAEQKKCLENWITSFTENRYDAGFILKGLE